MHLELRIDLSVASRWLNLQSLASGSSYLLRNPPRQNPRGDGAGLASFGLRPEADKMELSALSSLLCPANLLEFEAETFAL